MLRRPGAAGLLAALVVAGCYVAWNLLHGQDLFLDSWVLVHLLRVIDGGAELLPRGVLTLHYPLSYLPFWPLAKLFGPFATVKLVYPVLAALAAVPAYSLVRGGPLSGAGLVAILAMPDLLIKALNGTPQGIALPLFLVALYCALHQRRLAFVLAATAVLFTHHLTGFVTLVLYCTVWAVPRSRQPGFLRAEWPCLVYFSLWPLYWTWTFANTQSTYLGPAFLILAVAVGLPVVLLLYLLTPLFDGIVQWAGRWADSLSAETVVIGAGFAALLGWILSAPLVTPGLSDAPFANRMVVALYAIILTAGLTAALARRHTPLALFAGTILVLGLATKFQGCVRVFDGLRVADYAALGGLVALYGPGQRVRWASRTILVGVAVVVVLASGLRLNSNYERLFAHTAGQVAAARWIAAHVPTDVSIATDAKMSLLVLGEGSRNATFEGTWWLFIDGPIAPSVAALNGQQRFKDQPIRYVLLSDYMFGRGAEVTWFSPAMRAPASLPRRLDAIGERVYDAGGVAIWALDERLIAATEADYPVLDFLSGMTYGASAFVSGRLCK